MKLLSVKRFHTHFVRLVECALGDFRTHDILDIRGKLHPNIRQAVIRSANAMIKQLAANAAASIHVRERHALSIGLQQRFGIILD